MPDMRALCPHCDGILVEDQLDFTDADDLDNYDSPDCDRCGSDNVEQMGDGTDCECQDCGYEFTWDRS